MKKGEIKNRVGEKFITNEGYEIEIVEYFCAINCTIRFESKLEIYNISYKVIKNGSIKNPYHRSVQGIGYYGIGYYNSQKSRRYTVWSNMLQRCYNESYQEKYPTYKDCSVAEEWHNFQNFAKWYEDNYVEDFELDKDIVNKENKIYSAQNCCFVPREINALFKHENMREDLPTGVKRHGNKYQSLIMKNGKYTFLGTFKTILEASEMYKITKESIIKKLANKWRYKLNLTVYDILINYKN